MIREFEKEDLKQSARLFVEVYAQAPWLDAWEEEQAFEYLTELFENPQFIGFLLEEEEELAGVALGHFKTWYDGTRFVIDEFFVNEAFHRKGIGRRLMDFFKGFWTAEEVVAVELLTGKGFPAVDFYEAQGFEKVELTQAMEYQETL